MRLAGKQVTTPPPHIFPLPPGPWAGAHAKLHLMLYVQAIHTAIPMYSDTCSCCVCAFSWSFVDPVEGILLRVLLLILPLAAGGWGLKCPGARRYPSALSWPQLLLHQLALCLWPLQPRQTPGLPAAALLQFTCTGQKDSSRLYKNGGQCRW